MRRPHFLLFGMVIILVVLDQMIKIYLHTQSFSYDVGAVSFHFVPNYGISLGHFSNANPLIRVVLASTLFGLITMLYFGLVYYLWTGAELLFLRLGLSLFFSGIAGNAIDRIRFGYVIDFIEVKWSFLRGAVFNFADLVQLCGLVLTIFSFFYLNQKIWYLNNLRTVKIINANFQYSFAAKLTAIGSCSLLLVGIFAHSLLVALLPMSEFREESIEIFDYGMLIILLVQSAILFLFGIVFSHRISGPIYALAKFVKDLLNGQTREFKLRSNDYHPEIENIAKDIQKLAK
ncbi:MAG: signal peptidase II [Bdellovibrio sp.]|nr:signal peptidase II [Bdellovibrio sp.]